MPLLETFSFWYQTLEGQEFFWILLFDEFQDSKFKKFMQTDKKDIIKWQTKTKHVFMYLRITNASQLL
jgi:hypothetical protein